MKTFLKLSLLTVMCLILVSIVTGCECKHEWTDATCTTPKTCTLCQLTEGVPLGHSWKEANCKAPKTCYVCKKTQGERGGHVWVEASCKAPKTCRVCKLTQGNILEHEYVSGKCKYCNKQDPLGPFKVGKYTIYIDTPLPTDVCDFSYYGTTYSKCSLTEISFDISYSTLYMYFTGRKTYDTRGNEQSDICRIGWKLYDSDNYVIDSGTAITTSVKVGEGFRNQKEYVFDLDEKTTNTVLRLELLDVN